MVSHLPEVWAARVHRVLRRDRRGEPVLLGRPRMAFGPFGTAAELMAALHRAGFLSDED